MGKKLWLVFGTACILALLEAALLAYKSDAGMGYLHMGYLWLSGVLSALIATDVFKD